MFTHILLDGDILAMRVAGASLHKDELGQEYADSDKAVTGAVRGYGKNLCLEVYKLIENITGEDVPEAIETIWYKTALNSKEHNFRYKVATIQPYKGHRKEKPPTFDAAWEAVDGDNVKVVVGMEADDAICMAQHRLGTENVLVVSGDKDMLQTPGYYYSMITQKYDYVDDLQAQRNFWYQMVTGDRGDNIPSLSKQVELKYGKEKSLELTKGHYLKKTKEELDKLANKDDIVHTILGLYDEYGLRDNLMEIGELLHLKRFPEDNFRKRLE